MEKELMGKTIQSASIEKHQESCDSENVLKLIMTDGSVFEVVGGYGGYTGNSCDEYVETIAVEVIKETK